MNVSPVILILFLSIFTAPMGGKNASPETEEEKQEKKEFMLYKCMKQEYELASCCNLPHMNKKAAMKCKDHLKKDQRIAVYVSDQRKEKGFLTRWHYINIFLSFKIL